MKARALAAVLLLAVSVRAQLTTDQKVADFQAIASLYAKQYAPYDWKKTAFGYDALDLAPWLAQVRASASDLEYLDVVVRYVAALNDTHSTYRTVSDFLATLCFHGDAYFNADRSSYRVLIDFIDPVFLPPETYPFEIGDEIVSVDGVKAADLVARFLPYQSAGSRESRIRRAVSGITQRSQDWYPRASELGESATVEILRKSGATETYVVPWKKSGVPLTRLGPARPVTLAAKAWGVRPKVLERMRDLTDREPSTLVGYGKRSPIWTPPDGFTRRLGGSSYDAFFSGVVQRQGYRIGFLRIPSFSPAAGTAYGLMQLDQEIQYLQENTDGLVVDVMRNPGGSACYTEGVLARLMSHAWMAMRFQKRVTWLDIDYLEEDLEYAREEGASQLYLDLLEAMLEEFRAAYFANRLTEPLSLCSVTELRGPAQRVYTKPALLLVDEFSTSGADDFAAMFQDNGRGRLFGYRTNGAGGSVVSAVAGVYSEGGAARVTESLMYRLNAASVEGFPSSHYIENVGVHPDIVFDYMRPEVLEGSGALFVEAFLGEMVRQLQNAGVPPSVTGQSQPAWRPSRPPARSPIAGR